MDGDEFEPLGQGQQIVRNSSIVEMHNDLDAVNDDGLTPAQLLAQFAAKDSGGVVNTGAVEWAPMDTAEPAKKPGSAE